MCISSFVYNNWIKKIPQNIWLQFFSKFLTIDVLCAEFSGGKGLLRQTIVVLSTNIYWKTMHSPIFFGRKVDDWVNRGKTKHFCCSWWTSEIVFHLKTTVGFQVQIMVFIYTLCLEQTSKIWYMIHQICTIWLSFSWWCIIGISKNMIWHGCLISGAS
jgi:hypothetical protein